MKSILEIDRNDREAIWSKATQLVGHISATRDQPHTMLDCYIVLQQINDPRHCAGSRAFFDQLAGRSKEHAEMGE
jgi:hypothetical protein